MQIFETQQIHGHGVARALMRYCMGLIGRVPAHPAVSSESAGAFAVDFSSSGGVSRTYVQPDWLVLGIVVSRVNTESEVPNPSLGDRPVFERVIWILFSKVSVIFGFHRIDTKNLGSSFDAPKTGCYGDRCERASSNSNQINPTRHEVSFFILKHINHPRRKRRLQETEKRITEGLDC